MGFGLDNILDPGKSLGFEDLVSKKVKNRIRDDIHKSSTYMNVAAAHESIDGGGFLRGSALATQFGLKTNEFLEKVFEGGAGGRPTGGSRGGFIPQTGGRSSALGLGAGNNKITPVDQNTGSRFTSMEYESMVEPTRNLNREGRNDIIQPRTRWTKVE